MWECSRQHQNRDEAKFCAKCGEKRILREPCSACGALLEPDDVFCTSCGQHRGEPAPVAAPVAAPAPPPPVPAAPAPAPAAAVPSPAPTPTPTPAAAPEPIFTAAPVVVEATPVPEPAPAPAEEPVTFSFGGALIEMKDDSAKASAGSKASAQAATGSKPGMSSTTTAILSFVLFALVLGLALYFVSR